MAEMAAKRGSRSERKTPVRWPSSIRPHSRRKLVTASQLDLLDRVGGVEVDELAGEQPGHVRAAGDGIGLRGDEGAERRLGIIARGPHGAGDQARDEAVQHLAVELVLVGEVVVEECAVHARVAADLLDRGPGEPVGGEQAFGGVEDEVAAAGVGGRLGHPVN